MHYLAKQAARTHTLDSGVRPRLPSRFETPPDGAPFEPVMVESGAPAVDASPRETPRAMIVEQVLRREAERGETAVERILSRGEPPRARHEIEMRTTPGDESPAPERVAGPGAFEPYAHQPPAPPHIDPRIEPRLELRGAPQPSPRSPEREPLEPPPFRTILDERLVRIVERTESAAAPRRREEPQRVQPSARPAEPPPAPRPHSPVPITTHSVERIPPLRARGGGDAPPAIHVTIGRVDVRAVVSSDAPARPAAVPSQPSLSLEDYLRQREGRSR